MIFLLVFRADDPFLLTIHIQQCLDTKTDQRENGLDTYLHYWSLSNHSVKSNQKNFWELHYLFILYYYVKTRVLLVSNSTLSVYQSIQMRIQWHLFTYSK